MLTKPGTKKSWSPNTLKTRAVLNFKGIPYTQSFISYPDIAPLLKQLSVPPAKEGMAYTLPAIVHKSSVTSNPNGALMDSTAIAFHLEKTFPSPTLFPSGDASYALTVAVGKILGSVAQKLAIFVLPNVAEFLDRRGKEYFVRTRTERFGKPLSEVRPKDEASLRSAVDGAKQDLATLAGMLKGREGKTGPFFEGEKAGYADLMVVTFLAWFHRGDEPVWRELVAVGDGELKALWEACSGWLEGQGKEVEWEVPM